MTRYEMKMDRITIPIQDSRIGSRPEDKLSCGTGPCHYEVYGKRCYCSVFNGTPAPWYACISCHHQYKLHY